MNVMKTVNLNKANKRAQTKIGLDLLFWKLHIPQHHCLKYHPFTVAKAIQGKFGTVKKITKMKSGALLIEATRASQAQQILASTELNGLAVTATAHRTLNSSKGVIKDYHKDLYYMSDEDILNELSDQGVTDVSPFLA